MFGNDTAKIIEVVLRGEPSRPYLLRVFVDIDRMPPEIVTVYWTSRLEKYRSPS